MRWCGAGNRGVVGGTSLRRHHRLVLADLDGDRMERLAGEIYAQAPSVEVEWVRGREAQVSVLRM